MKILIMSDNHANRNNMKAILKVYRSQVDYIIHCGDSEFESHDAIWSLVDIVVAGNMDFDPQYPAHKLLKTDYGTIFVAHGHRHEVHYGPDALFDLAKREGYQFVFHGHTHQLYANYLEGILCLNPGSLRQSRGPIKERTFALVDVTKTRIEVEFYDDKMEKLSSLSQAWERFDD